MIDGGDWGFPWWGPASVWGDKGPMESPPIPPMLDYPNYWSFKWHLTYLNSFFRWVRIQTHRPPPPLMYLYNTWMLPFILERKIQNVFVYIDATINLHTSIHQDASVKLKQDPAVALIITTWNCSVQVVDRNWLD